MGLVGTFEERAFQVLAHYTGSIVARSIVNVAIQQSGVDYEHATALQREDLLDRIDRGLRAFLSDAAKADKASAELREAFGVRATHVAHSSAVAGNFAPASHVAEVPKERVVQIDQEYDIVTARGECRALCAAAGFPTLDQVKIATVVSELARNIVQYAGTGRITLTALAAPRPGIEIQAVDHGQGISNLSVILSGTYVSKTGMGVGIVGAKRLMDEFDVETGVHGTKIVARKYLMT